MFIFFVFRNFRKFLNMYITYSRNYTKIIVNTPVHSAKFRSHYKLYLLHINTAPTLHMTNTFYTPHKTKSKDDNFLISYYAPNCIVNALTLHTVECCDAPVILRDWHTLMKQNTIARYVIPTTYKTLYIFSIS